MAGQLTRDEFIEYMEPTLHETFSAGFNAGADWQQVFVMEKSDKRREETVEFTTPDVVIETPEGGPYARLQVQKVYDAAVIHAKFTGEVRISHEFIQDNFYRQIEKDIWGLGDAMARKLYRDACTQLYSGFSGNATPDGGFLFSNHTLKFSTLTYNNSSLNPLSSDALNIGITNLMTTLDENGSVSPFGVGKIQLIVPPQLQRLAVQLCRSPYEPDTANWAANVYNMEGKGGFMIEPVVLPLLAEAPAVGASVIAATQWYLRDAVRAENIFFSREEPKTEVVKDPHSPDVLYQVLLRYSFLIPTWRGLYGSQG
jgi:hypothetical protein